MIEKLWVDVETTGLNAETDTIIELAAIYQEQEFQEYCLPDKEPENFHKIEQITGISWEFLEFKGVSEAELYQKFTNFLNNIVDKYDKTDKLVFSGYNPTFDNKFVRELFKRNNDNYFGSYFYRVNFDLISLVAQEICAEKLHLLPSYKLSEVCRHYGIEFKAHSAIEDIKATIQLYEKIQEAYNGPTWKRSRKALQELR